MMKNIFKLTAFLCLFGIVSCNYDYPKPSTEPLPTNVSFATQVLPIFTANCISCHNAVNQSPDLTSVNAYNELTAQNLIDTTTPTNSMLYKKIKGLAGGIMPPGSPLPDTDINLILSWIQEGAKNN